MRRPLRRALLLGVVVGAGIAFRQAAARRRAAPAPAALSTPTPALAAPARPQAIPTATRPPSSHDAVDHPRAPVEGADLRPAPLISPTDAPATPEPDLGRGGGVEPAEDGSCPDGYPVKAKAASGIFHVPGGLSYGRTRPDRCYATAHEAEADGFRAARR